MRKRLLLGTAAIILPFLMSACSEYEGLPVPGIAEEEVSALRGTAHELGVFHFSVGNYGLAVQHFQAATSRNVQSVESWNGLAASYDKINRFDLAERYYRRALRVDPQSAQTLNNLGYSYWLQGRYDLALAYLRDADQLDGGNRVIEANRKLARDAYIASREGGGIEPVADVDEESAALLATIEIDSGPRIERLTNRVQSLVTRPVRRTEVEVSSHEFEEDDSESLAGLGVDTITAGDTPLSSLTHLAHLEHNDDLVDEEDVQVPEDAVDVDRDASISESVVTASLSSEVLEQDYITSSAIDPRDDGADAIEVTELTPPLNLATQIVDWASAALETATPDESNVPLEENVGSTPTDLFVAHSSYAKVVLEPVAPRIEVMNAAGRSGMAERLGRYLALRGLPDSNFNNAEDFDREETVIVYREGWQVYAMGLASLFPAEVRLEQSAAAEGGASADIRIEIGDDLLRFDGELLAKLPSDDEISG